MIHRNKLTIFFVFFGLSQQKQTQRQIDDKDNHIKKRQIDNTCSFVSNPGQKKPPTALYKEVEKPPQWRNGSQSERTTSGIMQNVK